MDWLDEKLDKINIKIANLSLRKSIVFYMGVFIILVIILTFGTAMIMNHWDGYIWGKYNEPNMRNHPIATLFLYGDYSKLSDWDRFQVEVIDFIQTWSVFIYSIAGIMGASLLFYKNKLKQPLRILEDAAKKMGNSDLDIVIRYGLKDEMGALCDSFELMRKQLIANNQKMWDVMEEQKRLNAAFAHDLRTPLTVLRGYTDFLKQYVPEGKVSEEKLASTLTLLSNNMERLERYSNTMKEINSLDEMPIHQTLTEMTKLETKLYDLITIMEGRNGITFHILPPKHQPGNIYLDETIVMEVVENLVSNALRYAKSRIEIALEAENASGLLLVSVCDDGRGFSGKDLSMATKPYYKDNQDNKSYHFGIGLYICRILCEKHGGSIALANSVDGGAIVTASFCRDPLT